MANSKGATKGYNGYKNYAQWNQSLWISNDEGLYRKACHLVRVFNREDAARFTNHPKPVEIDEYFILF